MWIYCINSQAPLAHRNIGKNEKEKKEEAKKKRRKKKRRRKNK